MAPISLLNCCTYCHRHLVIYEAFTEGRHRAEHFPPGTGLHKPLHPPGVTCPLIIKSDSSKRHFTCSGKFGTTFSEESQGPVVASCHHSLCVRASGPILRALLLPHLLRLSPFCGCAPRPATVTAIPSSVP